MQSELVSQAASNHSKNVSSTWCLPVSQWSWLKHTCERILHNKHLYHDAKHFAFPTERRMQRWQWGQEGHVCQNWREKLSISIGRLFFLHLQPLLRLFFLHCHYNSATMEMKSKRHHFYQVGGNKHTRTADEHSLIWCLSHWRQH